MDILDFIFNAAKDSQGASEALGGLSALDAVDIGSNAIPAGVDLIGGLTQGLSDSSPATDSAFNAAQDSQAYNALANIGPAASAQTQNPDVLGKLLQGFGIQGKDGQIDYSDPKVMDKIMRAVVGGGNVLNSLTGGNQPRGQKSPSQIRAELAGPYDKWTPAQAASSSAYFDGYTPSASRSQRPAASYRNPIVPGQRYAEGGDVQGMEGMMATPEEPQSMGALSSLVTGEGGGQDDLVEARLSPGEYVFDADVVSALGDGDNTRGAEILDAWREELREHKRSAPSSSIPPRAKAPEAYLSNVKAA